MSNFYKTPNKRLIARSHNGKFRKTTLNDIGLSTCECGHFARQVYFSKNFEMPDPREFGSLCFSCGNKYNRRGELEGKLSTEQIEQVRLANEPKTKSISFSEFMNNAISRIEKN